MLSRRAVLAGVAGARVRPAGTRRVAAPFAGRRRPVLARAGGGEAAGVRRGEQQFLAARHRLRLRLPARLRHPGAGIRTQARPDRARAGHDTISPHPMLCWRSRRNTACCSAAIRWSGTRPIRPGWKPRCGREGRAIFTDYIRPAAPHYRGRMHSWDVVNEAIETAMTAAPTACATRFWLTRSGRPTSTTPSSGARGRSRCAAGLQRLRPGAGGAGTMRGARRRSAARGLMRAACPSARSACRRTSRVRPQHRPKKLSRVPRRRCAPWACASWSPSTTSTTAADRPISRRATAPWPMQRGACWTSCWTTARRSRCSPGAVRDRFLKAESVRNQMLRGTPRLLPLDERMRPTPMRAALAAAFAGARKR